MNYAHTVKAITGQKLHQHCLQNITVRILGKQLQVTNFKLSIRKGIFWEIVLSHLTAHTRVRIHTHTHRHTHTHTDRKKLACAEASLLSRMSNIMALAPNALALLA